MKSLLTSSDFSEDRCSDFLNLLRATCCRTRAGEQVIGYNAPSADGDNAIRRRALGLTTVGRHVEAVPLWRELAQRRPGELFYVVSLGTALLECEQAAEAVRVLSAASEAHADDAQLAFLTGLALLKLKAGGPAIGAFFHALALRPGDARTHAMLGAALLANGQLDAAAQHGRAAFELEPTAAHATTLSCILLEQGAIAEALSIADQGLATRGLPLAELLVNRSIALECLGDGPAAVHAAQRALLTSRTATIEHHMAALLLSQGELTPRAWASFEARLLLPQARRAWPDPALRWTGQDVAGKTVLLHAEQGLGDTLQFVRYVPMVVALGARVVLAVQPALRRLLTGAVPAEVVAVGAGLPLFDYYTPLLSLPGVFGTTLETVPPPIAIKAGRGAPRSGRLRLGLVWAGSGAFVEDLKRSVPPSLLWPLSTVPNVDAFSLQWPAQPLPAEVTDAMDGVGDMADTAARLSELDLVISVDTAVAHLAATMGKPVWLLSRFRGCWRWLEKRSDSPWYPTVRLYRQSRPGDWAGVLAQVEHDLVNLAAGLEWREPLGTAPLVAQPGGAVLAISGRTPIFSNQAASFG